MMMKVAIVVLAAALQAPMPPQRVRVLTHFSPLMPAYRLTEPRILETSETMDSVLETVRDRVAVVDIKIEQYTAMPNHAGLNGIRAAMVDLHNAAAPLTQFDESLSDALSDPPLVIDTPFAPLREAMWAIDDLLAP